MPAGAHNIWQVPAFLPYVQEELTASAITEAEEFIGHPLPPAYINLLRVQNGGYIRYHLEGEVHRVIKGIGPAFPSLTEFYWADWEDEVEFPLDGLVPFDGDGHWHLCFDYREHESEPPIALIDVECNTQAAIANSFTEYLAKLRLDINEKYVLTGVDDIERAITRITELSSIRFEPPSSWDHGYAVHRGSVARLKHEWLWLSPNTVPRGFVRAEDPRYAELKDKLPGVADRFPELAAGSWLLGCTDKLRPEVLDALARVDIPARLLSELVKET